MEKKRILVLVFLMLFTLNLVSGLCIDYDEEYGSESVFIPSYAEDESNTYEDECINGDIVKEYYCGLYIGWDFWNIRQIVKSREQGCVSGCIEGRCLENQDIDGDGILNIDDNCIDAVNPYQEDTDNDDIGDACDNCRYISNNDQADSDESCFGFSTPYTSDPECGDVCEVEGIRNKCEYIFDDSLVGYWSFDDPKFSCNELGWNDLYGSPYVCGERDAYPRAGCPGNKIYYEALHHCTDVGARLCTLEEIQNDETRGTGCNYDNMLVWTSTTCDGGHYVEYGASYNQGPNTAQCVSDNAYYNISCCADNIAEDIYNDYEGIPYGVPSIINGKVGNAIDLSTETAISSESYIDLGQIPLSGLINMTISLWVHPKDNKEEFNYGPIVSYGDGRGEGKFDLNIFYQFPRVTSVYWINDRVGYDDRSWSIDNNIPLGNRWVHIVVVIDKGIPKYFYIDGERYAANSINYDLNIDTPHHLFVGKDLTMQIDELAIFNKALSTAEVMHLYSMSEKGLGYCAMGSSDNCYKASEGDMVSYYNFDDDIERSDDFDYNEVDTEKWATYFNVTENNGKMLLTIPEGGVKWANSRARMKKKFQDFDVQVDYDASDWVGKYPIIYSTWRQHIYANDGRTNYYCGYYKAHNGDTYYQSYAYHFIDSSYAVYGNMGNKVNLNEQDYKTGKLRMVRKGNSLKCYWWKKGDDLWKEYASITLTNPNPFNINLLAQSELGDQYVGVFDNFIMNYGETVEDMTINNNDGESNATIADEGIIGKSLEFKGIGDYVEIDDKGEFATEDFTWSFWMKRETDYYADPIGVIGKMDANSLYGVLVYAGIDEGLSDEIRVAYKPDGEDSHAKYLSMGYSPLGEWHHFTITKKGNTLTTYRDGNFVNEVTGILPIIWTLEPFRIGKMYASYWGPGFDGQIDEVAIFRKALNRREIEQLYLKTSNNMGYCDGWCGDAIVNLELGEECDDGNDEYADGCSPLCEKEGAECIDYDEDTLKEGVYVMSYAQFSNRTYEDYCIDDNMLREATCTGYKDIDCSELVGYPYNAVCEGGKCVELPVEPGVPN